MSTTIGVFDMFEPERPMIATPDPLRSPPPSWWSSQLEDMYEHKHRFPDVEVPGWDMALVSPPSPSRRTMEMLPEMDDDDGMDATTPPVSPSRRSLADLPDDTDTDWQSDMDVCPQLSPPSPIQRQSPLPTLESELDTPQTALFIEEDIYHPSPSPSLYTHMHTPSPLADRLRNEYTRLTSLRDRTLHAERTSRARNVALRGRERELGRAVAALRDASATAANININTNVNTNANTTTLPDTDTPLTSLPTPSASLHTYRTLATRVMLERTEEKRRRKKDKERVKELRVILGVGVGALMGLTGDGSVGAGMGMGMGMEAYDGMKLMDEARAEDDAKVPMQTPIPEAVGTTATMGLGIEEDAKAPMMEISEAVNTTKATGLGIEGDATVPIPMQISEAVGTTRTMGLGIETTRMGDNALSRYTPCGLPAFATGFGRTTTTTTDLGIEMNSTHSPDGLVAESFCAEQPQRSRSCLGAVSEYTMGAEAMAHGRERECLVKLGLAEGEGEGVGEGQTMTTTTTTVKALTTTTTTTAGTPGQAYRRRVLPLPAIPPPPIPPAITPIPVSGSGLSEFCVDGPTAAAPGNAPCRSLPPLPLPLPAIPTLHCGEDAEATNGMFGSNLGLGMGERGEEGVTLSTLPTLQTLPAFPALGSKPPPPPLISETEQQKIQLQQQQQQQQQQLYPYSYPPTSTFTSTPAPTPGLGLCLSLPFSLPLPIPLGSPSSPYTPHTPHTSLTERTMAMRRLVARMTMRRRDLGMRSLVEAAGAMGGGDEVEDDAASGGGEGGGGVKSSVHVGASQQRKRAKSALGREVVVAEDLEGGEWEGEVKASVEMV